MTADRKILQWVRGWVRDSPDGKMTECYEDGAHVFRVGVGGLTARQFGGRYWNTARGPYKCPDCGQKGFPTPQSMGRHRQGCEARLRIGLRETRKPEPEAIAIPERAASDFEIREFLMLSHLALTAVLDDQVSGIRRLIGP